MNLTCDQQCSGSRHLQGTLQRHSGMVPRAGEEGSPSGFRRRIRCGARRAPHLAQDVVVAALEGDVEEVAQLGQLGARAHQPLREVPACALTCSPICARQLVFIFWHKDI